MGKILTCGPFVGSFFEEIWNFRPFVQWVSKNIVYDDLFVLSHYNSKFLYDENLVHIPKQYSFYHKTCYHLNEDMTFDLYKHISRKLKTEISVNKKYKPKDIIQLSNKYTKNRIKISILNKYYKKISVPDVSVLLKDFIVYIPTKNEDEEKIKKIYNYLSNNYNVVIIGDNIYYEDENFINNKYDMLDRKYEYILKILSLTKMVVCPVGKWTYLCNLQNVPVVSWGYGINQFKEGGTYHFNNNNCIIPGSDIDVIISSIEYFKERLKCGVMN